MADFPQSEKPTGRGALFRIPEDQRKSYKYPNYRGDLISPSGEKMKVAGWIKHDKTGKPYLSLVSALR
jgi:uncharacterized protein (DUF736 family)